MIYISGLKPYALYLTFSQTTTALQHTTALVASHSAVTRDDTFPQLVASFSGLLHVILSSPEAFYLAQGQISNHDFYCCNNSFSFSFLY